MAKEVRKVHISVSTNAASSLNQGTVAAGGLGGALKGVGAAASVATGGIRALTAALISSGIGAIVVAVGMLIGGIGGLINSSRSFSKELSGLKAILGEEGNDPLKFKELSDDAKRLGSTTAFTATQVVSLQTEFAKLGFTTDEIINATEATLSLAAASGTDLAEAAAVAGATLRGFGLSTTETQRVVDVMAKSFASSSLDMSKFTESMKLVAPIAATLKIPIEQATAALGILADRGVSGSLAGTQLRRVMSDLAMKTGLSFRESLTLTAEKLAKATSESEKLAIAKELVGDRAKGSLIALAENAAALDNLTDSLYDVSDAAKNMSEERLNNLDGDLVKLSSAWEGFMLGLEDGGGILNKLARGAVQALTKGIGFLETSFAFVGLVWDTLLIDLDSGGAQLEKVKQYFILFANKIAIVGKEIQIGLADVPFLGSGIDEAKARKELKQLERDTSKAAEIISKMNDRQTENRKKKDQNMLAFLSGMEERKARDTGILQDKIEDEFREGKTEKDNAAYEKWSENRKKFLEKLAKMEEDQDDETALEKIRRRKERHLKELDDLKLETTEKNDAALRINALYAELEAREGAKQKEKFEKMFGTTDPLAEVEKKREAHLIELEALEIEETEKEELKARIKAHYDALRDETDAAILEKKIKAIDAELTEEMRLRDSKSQMLYQTLDTAAQVAGEESEIARVLQGIKLALQLQELGMKMGLIRDELKVKAQAALSEAGIEGAKIGTATAQGMAETSKIGFPWNVITMASYALQAVMLIKSFASSKKKLTGITSAAGASGGGGGGSTPPAPPAFNVIGNTSAGDNMVASTIASVNSSPMRAYVVGSDVTTSQSLQRNTEALASID